MGLLDNDAFLFELNKLYVRAKNAGKGSVVVTCKKFPTTPRKAGKKKAAEADAAAAGGGHKGPGTCLFRATLGKKKISTTVDAKELEKFQGVFATTLKTNMDALKKKERKRKDKPSLS